MWISDSTPRKLFYGDEICYFKLFKVVNKTIYFLLLTFESDKAIFSEREKPWKLCYVT